MAVISMVNSSIEELFKFDQNVEVVHTLIEPDALYAVLNVNSKYAQCPECKHLSLRHHSQYARKVDDLPVSGHPVHITVCLHKWFCDNKDCTTKVFTERLNWLSPSSRKTDRLEKLIRHVGFSNNCMAAEKICRKMRISISHDAILYRIKKEEPIQPKECPFRRH
ncbi:transposase family protein [Neobacillus notoginsengisoli]|uniref:Transposase family protein n=1 Tax=Neobacillus notoginsengisoli TaxID=1578198 RepID=A0A417YIC7_9BACI|nr:transposase family protein [Neobacillus notoginsengisoli]